MGPALRGMGPPWVSSCYVAITRRILFVFSKRAIIQSDPINNKSDE